jgi:probable rRNA maturation factor
VEHELGLYLAHGLLHLLGHDHRTRRQEARMRAAEAALLRGEGMLARSA